MSQTTTPVRPAGAPVAAAPAPTSPAARVQDSATRAATSVDGVHALGSPGGRALVRALGRVPGGRPTYGSGVSVEVGPKDVALDVSLVLEYGAKAVDVANRVRAAVDASVAKETGLKVVEVNVTVADVHHPMDDVEPEPVVAPAVAGAADAVQDAVTPAVQAVQDAVKPPSEATEDPLDALPVELGSDDAKPADAESERTEDDSARTVVVLDADGSDSDGPKIVQADEVVIAERVVVVGEHDTERPSS